MLLLLPTLAYPNGPKGGYEISGWSPTHSKTFHDPRQFGLLVLV